MSTRDTEVRCAVGGHAQSLHANAIPRRSCRVCILPYLWCNGRVLQGKTEIRAIESCVSNRAISSRTLLCRIARAVGTRNDADSVIRRCGGNQRQDGVYLDISLPHRCNGNSHLLHLDKVCGRSSQRHPTLPVTRQAGFFPGFCPSSLLPPLLPKSSSRPGMISSHIPVQYIQFASGYGIYRTSPERRKRKSEAFESKQLGGRLFPLFP